MSVLFMISSTFLNVEWNGICIYFIKIRFKYKNIFNSSKIIWNFVIYFVSIIWTEVHSYLCLKWLHFKNKPQHGSTFVKETSPPNSCSRSAQDSMDQYQRHNSPKKKIQQSKHEQWNEHSDLAILVCSSVLMILVDFSSNVQNNVNN